jgi:hypothetical protein
MMVEILTPSMKHGDHADLGAQMPGIGRRHPQGFGCGLEQDRIDRLSIAERLLSGDPVAGVLPSRSSPEFNQTRGLRRNRRNRLSSGLVVKRVRRLGVPICVEPRQFRSQCGYYGRHATTHPWRKVHQPLDQAPAFRAGNKVDALIDQ